VAELAQDAKFSPRIVTPSGIVAGGTQVVPIPAQGFPAAELEEPEIWHPVVDPRGQFLIVTISFAAITQWPESKFSQSSHSDRASLNGQD
jgi:hypothetical protein